jgi:drug/metabolite transporter (DMT)-like permease
VSRESLGFLLGLLGVCVFAGTLPFTRLAVESLDPWFVTAGRAALSGLLAGATLLILRRRPPDRDTLKTLALVALCLVAGFPGFTALAMTTVNASHGGVVLGILPLATAVVSTIMSGERPGLGFWLAAVAGAALVVGFALRAAGGSLAVGDLLLGGAVASSALGYTLSGRATQKGMAGWEVISWVLVISLPLTLPAALFLAPGDLSAVSGWSWTGFAYVTLMSQYLGFFAWNAGLALGGVTRVSQVQLVQTFVTLLIAAALNREHVDPLSWIVATLVVGLVLVGRRTAIRGERP